MHAGEKKKRDKPVTMVWWVVDLQFCICALSTGGGATLMLSPAPRNAILSDCERAKVTE